MAGALIAGIMMIQTVLRHSTYRIVPGDYLLLGCGTRCMATPHKG